MRKTKSRIRAASIRKKKRRGGFFVFVRKTILVIILIPVVIAGFSLVYPDVGYLREHNPSKTAFMKFREREWRKNGEDRRITQVWVPFSRISPNIVKAVTIAEDDKFWTHEGFDFQALEEAAEKNLKRGKFVYGGSTISQQLAKNLYLSPDKSIVRKAKETILTWRLERTLTKRRILELYLNVAEWGDGIFGIEAAARRYYHRPASALTPSQAAHLAAVLPNPRKWDPTGGTRFVERRSDRILAIMKRRGVILQEYDEAMREKRKPEKNAAAPSDSILTGSEAGNTAPSGNNSLKPGTETIGDIPSEPSPGENP